MQAGTPRQLLRPTAHRAPGSPVPGPGAGGRHSRRPIGIRERAFDYVVTVTVRTRPTGRAKNYDVSFRYSEIRRPAGRRKNIMMCHFDILKMHRRFDGMIGVREDLVKLLARS